MTDGPKRLSILGATGSIGQSTLDVVRRAPERFAVEALVGNANIARLAADAVAVGAKLAVTADEGRYRELKAALSGTDVEVAAGPAAVREAAARPVDLVMAAIVGAAGLEPTLAAVEAGNAVALANKECLVSAGDLFMRAGREKGVALLPVDSEHSAIFQCFEQRNRAAVEKVVLTASGGPFRAATAEQLQRVTVAQALDHPNWDMGPKVTIDSATLMNKGLELIEAHHLFDLPAEKLAALVHPQSIVHSLVMYEDGSVLAQLGMPDMRTPIAVALAWPERIATPVERLDLAKLARLTFEEVDAARFPAPSLALSALARGGSAPCILNAANEAAVAAFLDGRIAFADIVRLVEQALAQADGEGMIAPLDTLADVAAADAYGRRVVAAALAPARG